MSETALPLFYRNPRPLNTEVDTRNSLARHPDFNFAATTNSVPLLASEFTVACKHYPIVFAITDGAQPMALLGLRNNENLFVDIEGQWAASQHIPAYVRRYPFIFMESADQSQFTLCIDEAATAFIAGTDNPFFNEDGPSEMTHKALEYCRAFQGDYSYTQEFANAVAAADLLIENRADISLNSGEKISLSGFRVIDEKRFHALPDETFLNWRDRGWLPLVYCHLLSANNWGMLIDRQVSSGSTARSA
jgi:hypothetical protein